MENQTLAAVEEFSRVAKRYLEWADRWSGSPEETTLATLRILPELYLAALALPDISSDQSDEKQDVTRRTERWVALMQKFESLPINSYRKVFSPLKRENEPVDCSLADDLASIYLDLDEGLDYFDKGDIEEAVWEWRFGFWNHWGRHLVGALSALHAFQSFDY